MYYIVGLGNPGEQYAYTRHNVGWLVLDSVVEQLGLPEPVMSSKYAGRIAEGVIDGEEVTLLYPETFMNKSGSAVGKLVPASEASRLMVVYDDVDVPLGEIKLSVGRGDGGHNGIKSIVSTLGTKDFIRLRIGIAPKSFWTGKVYRPRGEKMSNYVLGKFTKAELGKVKDGAERACGALRSVLTDGIEKAMNEYN